MMLAAIKTLTRAFFAVPGLQAHLFNWVAIFAAMLYFYGRIFI